MVEVFMVVDNYLLVLMSAALLFTLIVWKFTDCRYGCVKKGIFGKKAAPKTSKKLKTVKSKSRQPRGRKTPLSSDEDDLNVGLEPPPCPRTSRERRKKRSKSSVKIDDHDNDGVSLINSIQKRRRESNSSDIGIGNSIISDDESESDP